MSQLDMRLGILLSGSIDLFLNGRFCHSDHMGMRSCVHVFGFFLQQRRWNVSSQHQRPRSPQLPSKAPDPPQHSLANLRPTRRTSYLFCRHPCTVKTADPQNVHQLQVPHIARLYGFCHLASGKRGPATACVSALVDRRHCKYQPFQAQCYLSLYPASVYAKFS